MVSLILPMDLRFKTLCLRPMSSNILNHVSEIICLAFWHMEGPEEVWRRLYGANEP